MDLILVLFDKGFLDLFLKPDRHKVTSYVSVVKLVYGIMVVMFRRGGIRIE